MSAPLDQKDIFAAISFIIMLALCCLFMVTLARVRMKRGDNEPVTGLQWFLLITSMLTILFFGVAGLFDLLIYLTI